MKSSNPSSCAECHLSGVDLKDYIGANQQQTFAALRERGLIDVKHPGKSKILKFIARKPDKPSLITDKVRQQELRAFQAWIQAAVDDPELLQATANNKPLGTKLPVEVIRHARKDRVLASFIDNIWTEIARCSGCHSPRFNQKQVKEHGEQVSWIQPDNPQETLDYLVDAELIDIEQPEKSLLLTKPTIQVKHGGGQKMVVGDRSYKQFRRFIEDYTAVVNGQYTAADELPEPAAEISVATSMRNGIWLKIRGVPKRFDKMLLQVDLYRRDGRRQWSKFRWATADRLVAGGRGLWQQSLTLTASRESPRAKELRGTRKLPPGVYRAKVYIDRTGKLQKDFRTELNQDDFIGEVVIDSRWPTGYGRMTVVDFRKITRR